MEMLATLGIASVILSVVISSQSKYLSNSSLYNLADEIGLTISQAQSYGIAVKEVTPGSSDFTASFGLTVSLLETGSDTAYIFFADKNANQAYDGDWTCPSGEESECIEKTDMSRGNYVDSICIVRTNGADQCNSASRVDVTFTRPSTDAQVSLYNSNGQLFTPPNLKGVKIVLMSPDGGSRDVTVFLNGQVSVQ